MGRPQGVQRRAAWTALTCALGLGVLSLRCSKLAPDGQPAIQSGNAGLTGGGASGTGGTAGRPSSSSDSSGGGIQAGEGGEPGGGAGHSSTEGSAPGGAAGASEGPSEAGGFNGSGGVDESGGFNGLGGSRGNSDAGSGQSASGGTSGTGNVTPPFTLLAERSLLESNPDTLKYITLERVLGRVIELPNVEATYAAMIQSFTPRPDETSPGPYCNDEPPFNIEHGNATLNGFATPCPAEAGNLEYQLETWRPLAVVNRFDLAPADGANCGEQHLNFYYDTTFVGQPASPVRAYLRFSAVIANPSPERGLEACRPVVDFWASLSGPAYDAPESRARALEYALFGVTLGKSMQPTPEIAALIADGFQPFMSPQHFGTQGSVQWLYWGNEGLWYFFEQAFVPEAEGYVRRQAMHSLPMDAMLNPHLKHEGCINFFLDAMSSLMTDDVAELRLEVDRTCYAASSSTRDPSLLQGLTATELGKELKTRISSRLRTEYPDSPLYPEQIAARADFAATCVGCHAVPNSPWTRASSIAHISESFLEDCGTTRGEETRRCYSRSPVLKNVFLPRWLDILSKFWTRER
ncbi:MAG TPA: hypothetical protein VFQ61_33675 [Polyangiaceae bacterium]|nr:hypothetical protein [Polyangiaceae bacterium]